VHPSPGARAVETAHSGDGWVGRPWTGLTTTPAKSDEACGSAGARLSRGGEWWWRRTRPVPVRRRCASKRRVSTGRRLGSRVVRCGGDAAGPDAQLARSRPRRPGTVPGREPGRPCWRPGAAGLAHDRSLSRSVRVRAASQPPRAGWPAAAAMHAPADRGFSQVMRTGWACLVRPSVTVLPWPVRAGTVLPTRWATCPSTSVVGGRRPGWRFVRGASRPSPP
jgi:hypothetical protein